VADRRQKNRNWWVADEDGTVPTWERVQLAVLMDIRDELQEINRTLRCPNTQRIPRYLQQIVSRLPERKKKRVAKRRARA
jgi:hypothetical protein